MEHIPNAQDDKLRWLFIDMNSFFASCEQQEDVRLRGRPVIIVPSLTDTTCAIAASYEAKAYGIGTGTNVGVAKNLCPDLVCIEARHEVYTRYHNLVMAEVEKHTPIHKIWSIDEASSGLEARFCNEEAATALARRIKAGIAEHVGVCLKSSIGIAPNSYLAKIASNLQKPDGLSILSANLLPERLFSLKLSDLVGIGPSMLARLNRVGIWSVEQLWHLPPKHLRAIWRSVEGERFWYKLHGLEVADLETKKSVIGHSRVLPPALRPPNLAHETARELTLKACLRLRRAGLLASGFTLSVRDEQGRRWGREIKLRSTQESLAFTRILGQLWQQMLLEFRPRSLQKTSISLIRLQENSLSTGDLFDFSAKKAKNTPKKPINSSLSTQIDAINKKFGANTISFGLKTHVHPSNTDAKIAFSRVPDMDEFL